MCDKRIAIMGAGSIGTIMGAKLSAAGVKIDLIDSYKEHVDVLNEKGATVTGSMQLSNVPVHALLPSEMEGIYDYVFLICKQTGTREAVEQLLPHLGPDSTVCTLQNGVPEPALAELIGKERTVGGIVIFAATFRGPGVSESTSPLKHIQENTILEIGEIDGSITPRIKELYEIVKPLGNVEISTNLRTTRWFKVCVNSTQSALSAIVGDRWAVARDREDSLLTVAHIADECLRVARADGIPTLPFFCDMELKDGMTPHEAGQYFKSKYDDGVMKASMLQDLEKGRPCEINYINGYICRMGRKYGIPTPFNDMAVAVISAAQARKTIWNADEGMSFFRPLLIMCGDMQSIQVRQNSNSN